MLYLADALNAQGLILLSQSQHERAEEFFREAIVQAPQYADAYTNLGVALYMLGMFDDATETLRQAYAFRPDHPETLLNYGYSLWRTGKLLDARRVFERAVVATDMLQAHSALASLCSQLGDEDGAVHHARVVVEHDPNNIPAHDTLCDTFLQQGYGEEALAECDILVQLDPSYRYKRSLVMLTYGNKDGWKEHENCYAERGPRDLLIQKGHAVPYWFCKLLDTRWDGQPTGHLLVSAEQGFGDMIQFMRFLPLAAERCTKLTLVLPPTLLRIAKQSFNQPNIEVSGKLPHEFDAYCLIMSLAYLLDRTEDIPPAPYLVAPNDCYGDVRRLAGLKVGLVWAGRREHQNDASRSIPFHHIEGLLGMPSVSFVSLQQASEIDLSRYPITQVELSDWADTAALIDALDLVISVDTAVAHLAGALGKPVWLLNRYNTDWRWMLRRSDTPWYASMRIFRQPKIGDWDTVMHSVSRGLTSILDAIKESR